MKGEWEASLIVLSLDSFYPGPFFCFAICCNSIFNLGDVSSDSEKAAKKRSRCCRWRRIFVYWMHLCGPLMGRRLVTKRARIEVPTAVQGCSSQNVPECRLNSEYGCVVELPQEQLFPSQLSKINK